MKQSKEIVYVKNIMHPVVTCGEDETIRAIAKRIIEKSVNHIVVVDCDTSLKGVVTSWDITKAVSEGETKLANIITRKVITTNPNENLESVSRKLAKNNISALPVIDTKNKVLAIITSEDVSKLLGVV